MSIYELFHILLFLWHTYGSKKCMYVCMYVCMHVCLWTGQIFGNKSGILSGTGILGVQLYLYRVSYATLVRLQGHVLDITQKQKQKLSLNHRSIWHVTDCWCGILSPDNRKRSSSWNMPFSEHDTKHKSWKILNKLATSLMF